MTLLYIIVGFVSPARPDESVRTGPTNDRRANGLSVLISYHDAINMHDKDFLENSPLQILIEIAQFRSLLVCNRNV